MIGILHIVVARKPLEGTIVENCLKWNTGAINVDGCRIGTERRFNHSALNVGREKWRMNTSETEGRYASGRFPANLILNGNETLSRFPNTQSGMMRAGQQRNASLGRGGYHGDFPDEATENGTYGDSGSASRFFFNYGEQESDE